MRAAHAMCRFPCWNLGFFDPRTAHPFPQRDISAIGHDARGECVGHCRWRGAYGAQQLVLGGAEANALTWGIARRERKWGKV